MFNFLLSKQARVDKANAAVDITTTRYTHAELHGASDRKKRTLARRMQAALTKRQKLVNPSNQSTRTDRR